MLVPCLKNVQRDFDKMTYSKNEILFEKDCTLMKTFLNTNNTTGTFGFFGFFGFNHWQQILRDQKGRVLMKRKFDCCEGSNKRQKLMTPKVEVQLSDRQRELGGFASFKLSGQFTDKIPLCHSLMMQKI
jgi:hypothetical protein